MIRTDSNGKILCSSKFVRLEKWYLIRAGDPRSTTFSFTPYNFMKLFRIVDDEEK
jgi:hypothetical protein